MFTVRKIADTRPSVEPKLRALQDVVGKKLGLTANGADEQAQIFQTDAQVLRVPGAALSAWLKPDAGQALVDHLFVVDPMGQWRMRAPAAREAPRFKRDLDRLLRASAFWDTAGR